MARDLEEQNSFYRPPVACWKLVWRQHILYGCIHLLHVEMMLVKAWAFVHMTEKPLLQVDSKDLDTYIHYNSWNKAIYAVYNLCLQLLWFKTVI